MNENPNPQPKLYFYPVESYGNSSSPPQPPPPPPPPNQQQPYPMRPYNQPNQPPPPPMHIPPPQQQQDQPQIQSRPPAPQLQQQPQQPQQLPSINTNSLQPSPHHLPSITQQQQQQHSPLQLNNPIPPSQPQPPSDSQSQSQHQSQLQSSPPVPHNPELYQRHQLPPPGHLQPFHINGSSPPSIQQMHLSPQLQQQQPQPQQQPPKRESVSKPDSDSTRASQSGMEISVIDTGKSASPTDNKVYSLREPTPPSIPLTLADRIQILTSMIPGDIEEYSAHLHKIAVLLYADEFEEDPKLELELREKFYSLMDYLPKYVNHQDPIHSKLYLLVEGNFDIFIKLSTNHANVDISTKTIRFLTNILMSLNYWEIYNLLIWKPVIYHFLSVIHFDINECYKKFIRDYSYYEYKKLSQPDPLPRPHRYKRNRRSTTSTLMNGILNQSPGSDSYVDEEESSGIPGTTSFFSLNPDTADHDKFVSASLAGLTPKEKKKIRVDAKLAAHRIIKKTTVNKPSNKSSNYDPDVVHECQLPSADEPHKLCLRRFSRKYELIRHQETVHSKKKKLFKCYVCVKQHPGVGPRIFTRHDTLAKHIRVNHKISGKEAKAEVAYSKKHAEVVEEGDITVHVGRRKTKVDFELRAHMEKKKNGMIDGDESGYLDSDIDSGDEDDEEEISLTSSQPPPPPQHQQPPPPPPPPKRAEYTFINNTA